MSGQVVTTSTSTYVLDYEAMTCTRYPDTVERGPGYDFSVLREDCKPIPIIQVVEEPTMGRPLVLVLDIVRDGATSTVRTTTPVTKIEELP